MALNLNDIREIISQVVSNKLTNAPVITASDFNTLLVSNNIRHFKKKLGLPEEYSPGMPLPRQVFENTMVSSMDLRPFKVELGGAANMPLQIDEDGIAQQPDDMYYPTSLLYKYITGGAVKYRAVDILTDSEWGFRLRNSITRGTKKNPVCNFVGDRIRFWPQDLWAIDFTYLRMPIAPYYAVEYSQGYPKYDAANSTEMEWDDINQLDIAHLILLDLGIEIGREDVAGYAQMKQQQGA